VTYRIHAENTGSTAAYQLRVVDTIPAALFDISGVQLTLNNLSGASSLPTASVAAPGLVTDTFTLQPGDSLDLRFTARLSDTVVPNQSVQNAVAASYLSGTSADARNHSDPGSNQNDAQLNNYNTSAVAPAIVVSDPLLIDKQFTPVPSRNTYTIGEQFKYRLSLRIIEGTVDNVVVTDTLPAGLRYIGPSVIAAGNGSMSIASSAEPVVAGQVLTYTLGKVVNPANLPAVADDFITIDIPVQVDNLPGNQASVSLGNQVSLAYDTATGRTTRQFDADPATSGVQPLNLTLTEPVLSLVKSANPSVVSLGDELTYTLTVSHTGASTADAFDLGIVDVLPVGLTYVAGSASPLAPAQSGQTLSWSVPSLLRSAAPLTYTFRVKVAANAAIGTPINNSAQLQWASLTGASGATTSGRNGTQGVLGGGALNDYQTVGSAPITPQDIRSLFPNKTVLIAVDADNSGHLTSGDTLEYHVVLRNGNTALSNVVFTDPIPDNTTYVSGSLVSTQGTLNTSNALSPLSPSLSVAVGSMSANQVVTITFRVKVNAFTAAGVVIRNQGSVDSDQTVPTPTDSNDNAGDGYQPTDIIVSGTVAGQASLYASKTVSMSNDLVAPLGSLNVGDEVTYQIIISNTGTATANQVQFSDTVPAGVTITSVSANATYLGNVVSANLGNLNPGASVALSIVGRANTLGTHANQGVVTATGLPPVDTDGNGDPNDGNQTTDIVVLPPGSVGTPVLGISKTQLFPDDGNRDGALNAGETIRYVLIVRNSGSAVANNVVVTDALPALLQLSNVVTSQGSLVSAVPNMMVNLGSIGPGAQATVTVDALVPIGTVAGSYLVNVATVEASNISPTPSNPVSVQILAPRLFEPPTGYKVAIDRGTPVVEWRMFWFNSANTAAMNVRVSDPLPSNQSYVAGSLQCLPRGSSTVSLCAYDASSRRVMYEGSLGPDFGKTTEAAAANEVLISFRVSVPENDLGPFVNTARVNWDNNGNGFIDDEMDGGQVAISATATFIPIPKVVPVLSRLGLAGLILMLCAWALLRARRQTRDGLARQISVT
jgi:uncharacterized repeat protein (TIGR01451 family)/fimbrial isopeptide formation D2 family protein